MRSQISNGPKNFGQLLSNCHSLYRASREMVNRANGKSMHVLVWSHQQEHILIKHMNVKYIGKISSTSNILISQ